MHCACIVLAIYGVRAACVECEYGVRTVCVQCACFVRTVCVLRTLNLCAV